MRHAVLGAGGVGSFLGAALARAAGRDVLLLTREGVARRESERVLPGVVRRLSSFAVV